MCGICGIAGRDMTSVDTHALNTISEALHHRGPDDSQIELFGSAGLGFRRLAIIDLSGGRQPMSNENDRYWIVFNGEIYNFQELRARLDATGRHRFKTRSDTEVILHLYEEYQEECVTFLRGMFSFVIWDREQKKLFAARDRFGKKPFFYFLSATGVFVFASELKALRLHPACPKKINRDALNLYLGLQYIPAPHTIYAEVYKLPAAHTLTWQCAGPVKTQRYWDLSYEPKASLSYDEAKIQLRTQLEDSVRLRMISDVPLGAYLSGGVDSSLIVALMAQQSKQPIKTFSIGFEEEAYSELPYARMVAERYKTDHHEFMVKPELTDILPKLAWNYSEPFADSSALPSYYLARETRKHVTVALSGDGGDEFFAGYLRYRAMWGMQFWNLLPSGLRKTLALAADQLPVGSPISSMRRLQRLFHVGALNELPQYLRTIEFFHADEREALWTAEHWEGLQQSRYTEEALFTETLQRQNPKELIDRLMYLDVNHYLPDCLMVKTDIASMAHSLEVRSPLLDHVLGETVARWPTDWKYRPLNRSKHILKDTFSIDLPAAIMQRGKKGFGVPISEWFRGPLKNYLRDILLSPEALGRGYFRPETVRRYIDEHQSGKRERAYGLWALLMLELWFKSADADHSA